MEAGTLEVVELESLFDELAKCEATNPCDHGADWRGTMTCPCNISHLICDECRVKIDEYCSDGEALCTHCKKKPVFVTWLAI